MKTAALALAAAALAAGAAHAQTPSPFAARATLTTAAAETIAKTCEAMAKGRNEKLAIVVVNNLGSAFYVYSMEGALEVALDTAGRKARTAWYFRTPTSVLANRVITGPNTPAWMGMLPVSGGSPVMVDGQVAGAVGVGGGRADEACAQAGLKAVGYNAPDPAPRAAAGPAANQNR
jgi:uncharacterized protein GlcG (DUF336 family)